MTKKQQKERTDLERAVPPSLRHWSALDDGDDASDHRRPQSDVTLDMGWGRLIFAHTFKDSGKLAGILCEEKPNERDIAFYLPDPHVVLSYAPDQLFLDPSHTFRLWFNEAQRLDPEPAGFHMRGVQTVADGKALNRIYAANGMVKAPTTFILDCRQSDAVCHVVAVDEKSGDVLGTVTGVDHVAAFGDPEQGSSLWCLAVAPEAPYPGIGRALVQYMAREFHSRGRRFMDLSVMHDNKAAIHLYRKLNFQRVPVFTIKRKNPINEPLFTAQEPSVSFNPYAEIIVTEARRRGIQVEVLDKESGIFNLTWGGRTIRCHESLTDLTSAVTMTCCDDKRITRRILQRAGLSVPAQQSVGSNAENEAFLKTAGSIVVKPARGEQGRGVAVDVTTADEMRAAIDCASRICDDVVLEQCVSGCDLRIVVIGYKVVAAALRIPPSVVGNGQHPIRKLIEKQSRRRAAATCGESTIPLDDETERCVRRCGHDLDDVLEEGKSLHVRKTANLHTGGILQDVTAELNPHLAQAAVAAAAALEIPVVGMDFIVQDHRQPDYVTIEANERPGLANHEPQPTAQRFIDLLFPQTVQQPVPPPVNG